MKNDVIKLVKVTQTRDTDGFPVETLEEFEVMAQIKSVGRTEFYQAAHEGINVSVIAVINLDDWDEHKSASKVKYDGELYRIIRTYKTSKLDVELTLAQAEVE